MGYIRGYLETCEGYGWEGGPEFRTRIVTMLNGFERRNGDWAEARRKFSLPFLNLSRSRYISILNMFYASRGQLHCFLYRDPLDNLAEDEILEPGDGVTQEFQLSKLTDIDGFTYRRNVYAVPDESEIIATVNGISSPITVDRDRGTIFFMSAPPIDSEIRWTGLFDCWVRFNQDYLPFSIDGPDAKNGNVELVEMPPPAEASS